MIALLTAFVLAHFDASAGWWWAYGITIALYLISVVAKGMR
jgi:hypothetical protein